MNLNHDAANRRRLEIEVTALVKKGPQQATVTINGRPSCSRILTWSGDTTLDCPLPPGLQGLTRISIATSYASSPKDWGSTDTRSLGIGLRAISLK